MCPWKEEEGIEIMRNGNLSWLRIGVNLSVVCDLVHVLVLSGRLILH